MENNQNNQGEIINKVFWFKRIKIAIFVLAGIIIILFLGIYALGWYGDWKFNKDLKALQQELDRPYLEDIYGGKTPKETLEMFIAAVEKEDFDLASKYFVLSKQEEWRKKLKNGKENNNISQFLTSLKKMEELGYLNSDNFQMGVKDDKGIYIIFINFVKYPQGIWKIQEI